MKLAGAYVEWAIQTRHPDRPKSTCLEGYLNDDGSPAFPSSLEKLSGEVVSREALRSFLAAMAEEGLHSCYDFAPISKALIGIGADEQAPVESRTLRVSAGTQPALTKGDKEEVVSLFRFGNGMSVASLARRFNVSRRTIDAVLSAAGVKKATGRRERSSGVKTARKPA